MMYWIIFALLSSLEGFADVLIGFWFPFYVELKILIQVWLIFPVSQRSLGSGVIYQKFIHRNLVKREKDIDSSLLRLREAGYESILRLTIKTVDSVQKWLLNLVASVP